MIDVISFFDAINIVKKAYLVELKKNIILVSISNKIIEFNVVNCLSPYIRILYNNQFHMFKRALLIKNVLLLFFCLKISNIATAQFGIHSSFKKINTNSQWTTDEFPLQGWSTSVDFTFTIPNYRVEFLPELGYSQVKTQAPTPNINNEKKTFNNQILTFLFNTNFYVFDLEGDCDCPVWSKDGNFFKKGFYLQLSPGVHYNKNKYMVEAPILSNYEAKDDIISYSAGMGVGIDFGLSERMTITPYFRACYHFDMEMEGYNTTNTPTEKTPYAYWQLEPGIRLGFYLKDEFARNKRQRSRREAKRRKKQKKGNNRF